MGHNFFYWLIVFVVLLFLIYTAYVIKNEKDLYRLHGKKFSLGKLQFLIPHWWASKEHSTNHLIFYRSDTRYEWEGHFILHPLQTNQNVFALERAEHFLEQSKIILDIDKRIIHQFKQHEHFDLYRTEGTGTEDQSHRVYLDLLVCIDKRNGDEYWLYSKSSVLNGAVEGPYFEEVINNLEFN